MPVGLNQQVLRFIRGHIYKLSYKYHYSIVRFKNKGHLSNGTQIYSFIVMADNISRINSGLKAFPLKIIKQTTIEEVNLNDLPRYIGTKYIGPEFEKVLKGEPIYRRKRNKILPENLHTI